MFEPASTGALSAPIALSLVLAGCSVSPSPRPPDDLDLRAAIAPIPGRVSRTDGRITIDSPAVLRAADMHVWGGSVVQGDDGRYHMFVARFRAGDGARRFGDEWLLSSEIAHAVSDRPDRDYAFDGVVLRGRRIDGDADAWDAQSVHNPHVRRFGDRVYLYHIGSRDPGTQPAESAGAALRDRDRIQQVQQTGVVSASSVADLAGGRFDRPERPLLGPRTRVKATDVIDPSPPETEPRPDNLIVVNPSVTRRPADAKYLLFFKGNLYDPTWRGVHGVALADDPAGPFQPLDRFVFDVRMPDGRIANAEDPFVWHDDTRRRFYAIVKDFSGRLTGDTPALALLTSVDGIEWSPATHSLVSKKELRFADGTVLPVQNLERPQLLFDASGRPRALLCACIVGPGYDGHAFNVQIPLRAE